MCNAFALFVNKRAGDIRFRETLNCQTFAVYMVLITPDNCITWCMVPSACGCDLANEKQRWNFYPRGKTIKHSAYPEDDKSVTLHKRIRRYKTPTCIKFDVDCFSGQPLGGRENYSNFPFPFLLLGKVRPKNDWADVYNLYVKTTRSQEEVPLGSKFYEAVFRGRAGDVIFLLGAL